MLRHVGIGARDEHAEPGDMRQRRPYLLSRDDPFVAVAHRSRGEPRHVGAGARLAEELAPDLLAREQWPQVALSLLRCPVRLDRRRTHPVSDGVSLSFVRSPSFGECPFHRELERRVEPEASVARREPDPSKSCVEARLEEIDRLGRLRVMLAKQRLQLPATRSSWSDRGPVVFSRIAMTTQANGDRPTGFCSARR